MNIKLLTAAIVCLVLVIGGSCRESNTTAMLKSSAADENLLSTTGSRTASQQDAHPPPYTEIEQSLDIPIEPQAGEYIAGGIVLENASVREGVMQSRGYNGWAKVGLNVGDPCLVVTGAFSNTAHQPLQVTFSAKGYDKDGNEVAWTMDSGPLSGILAFIIPAESWRNFTLHLNTSPQISRITIKVTSYTNLTPAP